MRSTPPRMDSTGMNACGSAPCSFAKYEDVYFTGRCAAKSLSISRLTLKGTVPFANASGLPRYVHDDWGSFDGPRPSNTALDGAYATTALTAGLWLAASSASSAPLEK